jgi:hypothetical protein
MKEGKVFYSGWHAMSSTSRPVRFAEQVPNEDIKKEPMFFNASAKFAFEHGGPITKSFIGNLPGHVDWDNAVFDSRVHMLMPGWYPGIPGWHHDDVPRPPIPAGQHFLTASQPDYENMSYKAVHMMGLVNAEVAPTQFIHGTCKMKQVPDGELIYRQWHLELEEMVKNGTVDVLEVPDRQLILFDSFDFHQAIPARKNGWRWFGRASIQTDRQKNVTNEIRMNAQVYLPFPMEGW